MPKKGIIHFEFGPDRPSEDVPFSLDEADLPLLRAYVAEAVVLEEMVVGFGEHSVGFTISARQGAPMAVTPREMSVLQRAALLHHLRPFVLDDEPFSFFKTRNIVAQCLEGEFIGGWLKELKQIFGGRRLQKQMKISSGQMLVNSEATLKQWLNAFEYHRDADKAEKLEKSLATLPDGMTRPVFFMMLLQKADAIRYLAHAVFKLLEAIDREDGEAA